MSNNDRILQASPFNLNDDSQSINPLIQKAKTKYNPKLFSSIACYYAEKHRFKVFPCIPRSKWPLIKGSFYRGTTDVSQIRSWWHRTPNANIGLATGKTGCGVIVLDFDPCKATGRDADEVLRDFEREYGPIPQTAHDISGRGYRFYFNTDESIPSKIGLFPGIDLKADKGYVLLPPSIHPNGRTYLWEATSRIGDVPIADLPIPMLKLIRSIVGCEKKKIFARDRFGRLANLQTVFSEGSRSNALTSFVGHLLQSSLNPHDVLEIAFMWNKSRAVPPLPEVEIIATVNSICERELRKRGAI